MQATIEIQNDLTATLVRFIRSIGIEVKCGEVADGTVLPGIDIREGVLIVDETKLLYPGDLLHEAGHIAVAPPSVRASLTTNVGNDPAEEMMAMAWSYAAIMHLKLDPAIVFHAAGYHGGSQSLLDAFANGALLGQPMLQWLGMTLDARNAEQHGRKPFPHMLKWVRDVESPKV